MSLIVPDDLHRDRHEQLRALQAKYEALAEAAREHLRVEEKRTRNILEALLPATVPENVIIANQITEWQEIVG